MKNRRGEKMTEEERKQYGSSLISYLKTFGVALVIALILRFFVIFPVRVEGPSMEDTLYTGDILMVEKVSLYFAPPSRMDVVIVEYPNREGLFVKRVVGLPGETLEVRDGRVYINGEAIEDPYNENLDMSYDVPASTVPPGTVYVMGDNRNHSMDSRDSAVGPIPLSAVKGKKLIRLWPL